MKQWTRLHPATTAGKVLKIAGNGLPFWGNDSTGSAGVTTAGNNDWTGANRFKDGSFRIVSASDTSAHLAVGLSGLSSGATRTWTAQDADGTVPLLELSQTWTDIQVFDDAAIGSQPIQINLADASGFNASALSIADVTGGGTVVLGLDEATTTTSFQGFMDIGGHIPVVGFADTRLGRVNATAQTADITTTNLCASPPAGQYRITGILEDTMLDATAGIVTLTIGWTDDAGPTTATATQVLTTKGRTPLVANAYVASGNVTYAVSHTGIFGSAAYALRVRAEYLGP